MMILEVLIKFKHNKKLNIYTFLQIYDFSCFLANFD